MVVGFLDAFPEEVGSGLILIFGRERVIGRLLAFIDGFLCARSGRGFGGSFGIVRGGAAEKFAASGIAIAGVGFCSTVGCREFLRALFDVGITDFASAFSADFHSFVWGVHELDWVFRRGPER